MLDKSLKLLLNLAYHFPYAQKAFSYLEYISAYAQGKGWVASLEIEVSLCASLLPDGIATLIDIGGNQGEYTNEVISKFKDARAFIFEPSNSNQIILDKKFSSSSRVRVFPFALSDSTSVMPLYADSPGSGGASLSKRKLEHFGIHFSEVEKVNVKRFDEIWNGESSEAIDLVKIDVEGYELNVLKGFGHHLQRVRVVQFEMGGTDIDTRTFFQDFWYFFEQEKFALFRMSPSGLVRIDTYREQEEGFAFKNYVALNKRFFS